MARGSIPWAICKTPNTLQGVTHATHALSLYLTPALGLQYLSSVSEIGSRLSLPDSSRRLHVFVAASVFVLWY